MNIINVVNTSFLDTIWALMHYLLHIFYKYISGLTTQMEKCNKTHLHHLLFPSGGSRGGTPMGNKTVFSKWDFIFKKILLNTIS